MVLIKGIKGYGEIKVREKLVFTIGSWTISIVETSKNSIVEYKREYNGNDKTYIFPREKGTRIVGLQRLLLQPIYPVLIPRMLTTSILIKYRNHITMAPGEQLKYYVLMPVDVAILSVKNQTYTLIDVVNVGEVKYAFYGSIETGVVARYSVSEVYFNEESALKNLNTGLALVKIKAHNRSREWVTLTKILLEANPLKLYYKENTWIAYSRIINFIINSPKTASIAYTSAPSDQLTEVIDPPELRVPLIVSKTSMPWGF